MFLQGDAYSAALDAIRWRIADNELFSVSDFIGDGVINGLEIESLTFPSIKVTKGSAIIDGFYVSVENDVIFDTLIPGETYHIYATNSECCWGDR